MRQPPPVLSAEISVDYPKKPGVLRSAAIEVFRGEMMGLVGQSGSGKSTLALALMRLLDYSGARVHGRITLLGKDLVSCPEREMRAIRGRLMSLIPQSPSAALNPLLRIGTQLKEAWRAHSSAPWAAQSARLEHLFKSAGLPDAQSYLGRFPAQISVGQAQRVLIVMALLHSPLLLIADEPTSALDLITQSEVLDLLAGLGREQGASILFISHDLAAVAARCSRIAILHDGRIVECGPVREVLAAPKHAYTQRLVRAVPRWER
jgi:ABC-type dipeptide/oligopeptide/nickel transport system ATPase component